MPEDVFLDDKGLTRRMEFTFAAKSSSAATEQASSHVTFDFSQTPLAQAG